MGEEAKKEEVKPVEASVEGNNKEEKKEEKKEEEEEAKPPPPPPVVVLHIDMHCVGCAKKIEKCLMKCKGVEGVETDMAVNQVKIKGVVDPQDLCSRIQKKTMRKAKVLSPLPQPDEAEPPKPQVVASQVSGVSTVELHVNMHCEACAQQLRKRILKMKGVQAAETELSSGKVMVTGTMTGDKLVDYIYRRTGKLAKVIPPPPPPPEEEKKEEEKKDEGEKKTEEKPPEEKPAEEKKEGEATSEEKEEAKKEGVDGVLQQAHMQYLGPDDLVKRMMYWNHNYNGGYSHMMGSPERMTVMPPWMPIYVVEGPPPPPQLFSDENPNACCIT